jgi:hypothetical protein
MTAPIDHEAKARELLRNCDHGCMTQVSAIAAALRAAEQAGAEAEREACATICDETIEEYRAGRLKTATWTADVASKAIRARGTPKQESEK